MFCLWNIFINRVGNAHVRSLRWDFKMFSRLQQNRGQTSLSEYVVLLFVVLGAGIAISTYLQRGLQARMRDTNLYMVDTVSAANGKQINYQYEPYYASVQAIVDRRQVKESQLFGSGLGSSGIYHQTMDDGVSANSQSEQAPPRNAD